jgi:hypothetical protein
MMTESCTCSDVEHPHHAGGKCERPAVSQAEEVEPGPDRSLGAVCLECYQLLAVEAHEADPDAVVDLNVPPSFLMCESPALGR